MGRAQAPPPAYTDASIIDADALSLHTTQADDDVLDLPENPPAYRDEDSTENGSTRPPDDPTVVLPVKVFDGGIHTFMSPRFDQDPIFAEETIRKWSRIPPAQMVQILGTHTETTKNGKKEEKNTVTDFDIKLRLTEYLFDENGRSHWVEMKTVENSEKTHRGTVLKKRAKVPKSDPEAGLADIPKPGLNQWCHLFCASHSTLKRFAVTRQVTNLDTRYIHDSIKSLIHATNYRGHVRITFPVENGVYEVYSNHWINQWRLTSWIRVLFYFSMLWLFTWPYLFFATKRWEVVKIDWPFSMTDEITGHRLFPRMSEKQWFAQWAQAIERAVLSRKQGCMTEEDVHRPVEPIQEFRSGNEGIDGAVNFLGAGIRAYGEINRQIGWGGDC